MPTENFSPSNDSEIPEETTPITSQPQSQTVDQYYSNLATTAEANRDTIQGLAQKSTALNEQLSKQENRLTAAEKAYKNSTGIFQGIGLDALQKIEEVKTDLVRGQATRVDNRLSGEESTLRDEYYGQTGNTDDFLRATDPTRLREIAQANQLNDSRGPSVRVSDMTAEQIQERKEFLEQQKALRESGIETKMPLPEKETLEQKEARYDQEAVEAFSSSITNILENLNDGYEEDSFIAPEYRRKITSEKSDIEVFSKMVYDERKKGGAFGIRDLGVGSFRLQKELDEHHNAPWYRQQENWYRARSNYMTNTPYATFEEKTAFFDEEKAFYKGKQERQGYVDRISNAETDAVFKIAMWNMTNEIYRDLGIEEVTSEQFVNMMKSLNAKEQLPGQNPQWASQRYFSARDNSYGEEASKYPNSRQFSKYDYNGAAAFIQTTSENIGKSPSTLEIKDIPYIIASYTNKMTENIHLISYDNIYKLGLTDSIKHALINDPITDSEKRKEFNLGIYFEMYQRRFVGLIGNNSLQNLGANVSMIRR